MKVAIVTDSTSYLTEAEIAKYDIKIVPMPFILKDKIYKEGVDVTTAEYYAMLSESDSFPTTSQPSVGEMMALYEELRDEGYEAVISIHLASTISGFVSNVASLEGSIEGLDIYAYDSKITVRLMGNLVLKAAQMATAGKTPAEILPVLDELRDTIDEYFVVDDLQNLVRGGRLSNAGALIGAVLKVKPILTFDNDTNHIVPFEKVRSMKKALKRTGELFNEALAKADYPVRAIVIHANNEAGGRAFQAEVQAQHPDIPVDLSYFGPVIGTHLGQGAIGLTWMRDIDSL
ncbi:DegV family protein [Weissella soli]|uniref:DegV family protein n=1 Tax=Weissella soli TaxID=155866 RepID=UPI0035A02476